MTASTPAAPGRIFINYRRDDTDFPAGWLYERLASRFGESQVFKDVDSIQLGDDFVEVINEAVGSCDVLLAVIGDQWLSVVDQAGRRRLDSPDDFVRLEIEAALARDVRVIPILVEGARMPRADELPPSLARLARRQALELNPNRFDADTSRLIDVLDRNITEIRGQSVAGDGHGPDTAPVPTLPPPTPPAPAPPAPTPPAPEPAWAPVAEPIGPAGPRPRRSRWWLGLAALLGVVVVAAALLLRPDPPAPVAAQGQKVTPLPPGTTELVIGFVGGFEAAEKNPDSVLDGFDPILFVDPATDRLRGLDVDLANALGDKLGVTVRFRPVAHFTHSLSDVRGGRVDIGMSVLRDREEGRKVVDFVDYLDPGTALLVPKDDPDRVRSLPDLCGRRVARPIEMPAGSVVDQSRRCQAAGKPPVTLISCPRIGGFEPDGDEDVLVRPCPAGRDPLQLVVEGRAHAAVLDRPVADRLLATSGLDQRLAIAGAKVEAGPYGIAVPKGDTQVRDAIRSALLAVVDDGTYDRILAEWDLERVALREATVNGGP
jgi:ABC-type amino acid transport substrate-binding protein